MASEETNFPTKFSYTKQDIEDSAERERLGEGYYPLLITDVLKQISKPKEKPSADGNMGENCMLVPVLKPMENQNDINSTFGRTLRDYWTLPFANELVPGHVPPGTWAPEMLSQRLNAVFPDEVTRAPYYVRNKGLHFEGERIDKDQEQDCRVKAYATVYPMAEKLGVDPSPLLNMFFWAEVFYEEGSDWPSIRNHCAELPHGVKLGEGMVKMSGKAPAKKKKSNGAKGRATASKKKASRKRS